MPTPRLCVVCLWTFLVILFPFHVVLAQSWQDIASDLMSPACPGRTLLNCTSGQAEQWRELIRQKLAQGESKDQIVQYFIDIRGEEILAAPPKRGFALTAWLFPLFLMLNGMGLIVALTCRWARKQRASAPTAHLSPAEESPAAEPTTPDPYRERLRRELEDFPA